MDSSWMADANCRGMDPEAFFPTRNDSSITIGAVLKVCESCSVQDRCLSWALHFNERDGIWGNTTGRQRRQLRGRQIRTGGYPVQCIECGTEFLTDSQSRTCSDECRAARRRASARRYKQGAA